MNREELLRSARNLYENPGTNEALKVVLEETYPELKEREDERIRKEIIDWMKGGTTYDYQENKEKWIAYLEKQKEQKPAEWSEEDEIMLRKCISATFDHGYLKECEWLKSLRPQPKAELTLLDQNIISAAVAFVEQNNHFNCWRGIDKHTVIKALRSLKPHWKPSKEQIQALTVAIDGAARCEDPWWKDSLHDVLLSLHTDLQKLL